MRYSSAVRYGMNNYVRYDRDLVARYRGCSVYRPGACASCHVYNDMGNRIVLISSLDNADGPYGPYGSRYHAYFLAAGDELVHDHCYHGFSLRRVIDMALWQYDKHLLDCVVL